MDFIGVFSRRIFSTPRDKRENALVKNWDSPHQEIPCTPLFTYPPSLILFLVWYKVKGSTNLIDLGQLLVEDIDILEIMENRGSNLLEAVNWWGQKSLFKTAMTYLDDAGTETYSLTYSNILRRSNALANHLVGSIGLNNGSTCLLYFAATIATWRGCIHPRTTSLIHPQMQFQQNLKLRGFDGNRGALNYDIRMYVKTKLMQGIRGAQLVIVTKYRALPLESVIFSFPHCLK